MLSPAGHNMTQLYNVSSPTPPLPLPLHHAKPISCTFPLPPQGRLFSYPDTHRHRLGPNYLQLPVNCPFRARVANYQRDGPMCMHDNQGRSGTACPLMVTGTARVGSGRLMSVWSVGPHTLWVLLGLSDREKVEVSQDFILAPFQGC